MIRVHCRSGRNLDVLGRHPVFSPAVPCLPGTRIDPAATPVESGRAADVLQAGKPLIVDDLVEVVSTVQAD